jgi:hypothetical protein
VNELHRDLNILYIARGRLWAAEPYTAPVPKTDFFDKVKTFREEMVGEGEDVGYF